MKLSDLAPWNWFKKKEEETEHQKEDTSEPSRIPEYEPTEDEVEAMKQFFDNDLDEDYWSSFSLERPVTPLSDPGLLRPYLDLAASGNEYVVSIDIPNVDKDDIRIDVTDNTLTVTGQKLRERNSDEKDFHLVEKSYGSFQRRFTIPEDADAEGLQALFKHGKLLITLPKKTGSA